MNARVLPATRHAALENELLSQLGLPPSASPEDVDALHEAASEYLAAAPSSLRGWANAQASALDAAYLKLTDPVGLEGSALRSPTRPPTVVPGGPATPPARRDSVPATTTPAVADGLDDDVVEDEAFDDDEPGTDYDALYAAVTPSAHADMAPDTRPRRRVRAATAAPSKARRSSRRTELPVEAPASGGFWKKVALGGAAIVAVFAIVFGANAIVNSNTAEPTATPDTAQASASAPAVDQAQVAQLMTKYAADPNDTTTLLGLADAFYAGQDYSSAGEWLDKLLAIDPKNVQALLAKGAVSFNLGDLPTAESTWKQVVDISPDNVEVHYDLGFLYLNQTTPDWAGVQSEWTKVIQLDPGSDLAQTVQSHLDALVAASMIPASPGAPGSPAANGSPAASPAAPETPASPAASPAASQPAASPAPTGSATP